MNKEIKCYCGHTTICDCGPLEEPKQETLEEASWKYNPLKKLDGEFIRHEFINGAKWQQEQDKNKYSEEDLEQAFKSGFTNCYNNNNLTFGEWFEQFTKK